MNREALAWWVEQLRSAGEPVAAGIDLRTPFRDDHGHTRPVDAPFIAWLRREQPGAQATADAAPDVLLWEALARGDPASRVEAILTAEDEQARTSWDSGALLPQRGMALEAWTEADLCAMHALWRLGTKHGCEDWLGRVDRAAAWHMENVQPDNATAHPWAVHVFAIRHAGRGDLSARLHAELLMHNCRVNLGRADRLSALVLRDAAEAISGLLHATA